MARSATKCLGEHSLASYADAGSRRFLALFLIALFRVKTVNLSELSTGFMGQAKTDSHYKRLQRFLREFDLDYYARAKLVVGMMEIHEPGVLS